MNGAGMTRGWTAAAVGGLMLVPAVAAPQPLARPAAQPVAGLVSYAPGAVHGIVLDDTGAPVEGAMVSALGARSAFTVSDRDGRFEFPGLAPGSYVLRVHRAGFAASRPALVEVRAGERTESSIALTRAAAAPAVQPAETSSEPPVIAAEVGLPSIIPESAAGGLAGRPTEVPAADRQIPDTTDETAWRLRHARRGILRGATVPRDFAMPDEAPDPEAPRAAAWIGNAAAPARLSANFFSDALISGQVHLLTTGSFDSPEDLFGPAGMARGIAHVRVGAAEGSSTDWTVRGALTEADITAWILAASYSARAAERHRYDVGMSYSTQRYDGGNPLALRDVADGSRNVGTVYGFDTLDLTPALTVSYGGRYARYDYLEHKGLFSPRLEVAMKTADGLQLGAVLSSRAHAPGAEEFLPPDDAGLWLPPQRTFSSIEQGRPFEAERTMHAAVEVSRDFDDSSIAFRVFRQQVDDQLVTVFGADLPEQPSAKVGHYVVGNAGDVTTLGWLMAVRTTLADRVQGSVAYSLANAHIAPAADLEYVLLLAPSAVRPPAERIHDLTTVIQADVPETSTRLVMLYRISNAFARPAAGPMDGDDRPGFDGRFDVQVRQSLPFLNFTSARWEMLVAVRNFFRERAADESLYDELLVVRPPKRLVGGVTVNF
jgi:hypothetical protein